MKHTFSKKYRAALLAYLKKHPRVSSPVSRQLGQQALKAGLRILELAKLHEDILVRSILPGRTGRQREKLIKQAGAFFTKTITPIEKAPKGMASAAAQLNKIVETLSQRTVELAASNLELRQEIKQRKAAEMALQKSERHSLRLLEKAEHLRDQLRHLSRQLISAQEDERKQISRELHDVIAQTLTGINLRLAALKKEGVSITGGLNQDITSTQQLVENSVDIVHQFARELRPAVLDDLGLIPALHSYMKSFATRTSVRAHLTAFAGVEKLDMAQRTALYRVAQEALTNVARHAQATRVDVSIQQSAAGICMTIKDDGKSFVADRVFYGRGLKRLGLLGMRERLEMVGGQFKVKSAPRTGTTVCAEIPFPSDGKGETS